MPDEKNTSAQALTKKDMVNYIGPIFEELKSDNRRLEVLMDAMERKIMGALETYTSVTAKEEVVNKHEKRITRLETDMTAVKTTLKTENTKF